MSSPTLIFREVHDNDVFTIEQAVFVTPRGSCGVRKIYRISRERVAQVAFTNALEAARSDAADALDDFNYVGSRHHY